MKITVNYSSIRIIICLNRCEEKYQQQDNRWHCVEDFFKDFSSFFNLSLRCIKNSLKFLEYFEKFLNISGHLWTFFEFNCFIILFRSSCVLCQWQLIENCFEMAQAVESSGKLTDHQWRIVSIPSSFSLSKRFCYPFYS